MCIVKHILAVRHLCSEEKNLSVVSPQKSLEKRCRESHCRMSTLRKPSHTMKILILNENPLCEAYLATAHV